MQHGYRLEATEVSKNIEVEDNNFRGSSDNKCLSQIFFSELNSINLSFYSFSKAWHITSLGCRACEFFWSKKKPALFFSDEKDKIWGFFLGSFFSSAPPHPFPYCDSVRRGQPLPNF